MSMKFKMAVALMTLAFLAAAFCGCSSVKVAPPREASPPAILPPDPYSSTMEEFLGEQGLDPAPLPPPTGEPSSASTDEVRTAVFPVAEKPVFDALVAEGGTPILMPSGVVPDGITASAFEAQRRGDNLYRLKYLQDSRGRWQAIMAPYKIDEEAGTIEFGFHGIVLAFDADQARERWRRLRRADQPSDQMSDTADWLIARLEEAGDNHK